MKALRALRAVLAPAMVVALVVVALLLAGPVACGGCNVKITSSALPEGFVGVDYSYDLQSECGGDVWFLEAGNLPPGIQLLDNGKLRGAPLLEGVYPFTIGVVDYDDGDFALRGFVLTVVPASAA